ncbi:MAG: N-methyl-L-tryptophan oxidase [Phycisphaerales bacterium]|nr:N-methyl-L-tryptophan oxidase [Phycisphaerae bacterium]NNF42515.1 N-methyl-L-tryptophan oxidase [Phycisphaerales bacterium]NNM24548.1 N-methyl-L-tryptophan oxidase [Phycisphaerales bacterium]
MSQRYDAIVIGLGVMGLSVCRDLARRGARVLGLDRFGIAHTRGSSHGATRVFRVCYYERPEYVPLLQAAERGWRELEREVGETLLYDIGLLYAGRPSSDLIRGTQGAAAEHGLSLETLDASGLSRRFPLLATPPEYVGLFEPAGGVLMADRIVGGLATAALAAGAELRGLDPVAGWTAGDGMVTVRSVSGTHQAGVAIVCAGGWTSRLLPTLAAPLTVTRQIAAWIAPAGADRFRPPDFPVWGIDAGPQAGFDYGFPLMPGRPGLKVARHWPGPPVDPDRVDPAPDPAALATLLDAVRTRLPAAVADGGEPAVLSVDTCLYTNTPDGHFVIDRLPSEPRVLLAAGFSGHGFKFASIVGEALADLALEGGTALPIDFLGLDRFRPGPG